MEKKTIKKFNGPLNRDQFLKSTRIKTAAASKNAHVGKYKKIILLKVSLNFFYFTLEFRKFSRRLYQQSSQNVRFFSMLGQQSF